MSKSYKAGRRDAIEAAIYVCCQESLQDAPTAEGRAYQQGITDCVNAIRALIDKEDLDVR